MTTASGQPEKKGCRPCPICGGPTRQLYRKGQYDVLKCADCGLGVIDPLPGRSELEAFYNSEDYYKSPTIGYDDYGVLEAGLKKMYRRFLRDLRSRHGFSPAGKNVLDVGCAYGYFLDVAAEAGAAELWGTDITREGERATTAKGHRFHLGPFEDCPLPEAHFDLIFLGDVFEHLSDPVLAVSKLRSLLREDGLIVLTTVDFDSLFVRIAGPRWRLLIPPEHIYYWTRKSLATLFGAHGLTGACSGYTLPIPKDYLAERFREQFGFRPWFLLWLPVDIFPIPSFDTIICVFRKRSAAAR